MADKTRDQYYDRLEALIDKLMRVGEAMDPVAILAGLTEHPERYGSFLAALYRCRAMVSPGESHAARTADMSDSQREDWIVDQMRKMGYEVKPISTMERWNNMNMLEAAEREADESVTRIEQYSRKAIK